MHQTWVRRSGHRFRKRSRGAVPARSPAGDRRSARTVGGIPGRSSKSLVHGRSMTVSMAGP
ncbi:hypothetical protein STXM2123_1511 [Streptomyces sp. F-3]|nr:hypothetical protein STXM2123_1511 [Streptomyces sp. F-3]